MKGSTAGPRICCGRLLLVCLGALSIAPLRLTLSCRIRLGTPSVVYILLWPQLSLLLVLCRKVLSGILVEIKIEGLTAGRELFIRLRDVWTILLNLLNLLKMFLQSLGSMWCVVPLGGLFDYGSDRRIFNHDSDVDRVVHTSENPTLICVWNINILEELKPESFKFVSIVLKKIEVIADSGENFVEVFLKITTVFFGFHFALNCITSHGCCSGTFSSLVSCVLRNFCRVFSLLIWLCSLDLNLLD